MKRILLLLSIALFPWLTNAQVSKSPKPKKPSQPEVQMKPKTVPAKPKTVKPQGKASSTGSTSQARQPASSTSTNGNQPARKQAAPANSQKKSINKPKTATRLRKIKPIKSNKKK